MQNQGTNWTEQEAIKKLLPSMKVEATDQPVKVVIIEKGWFDSMIKWVTTRGSPKPGAMNMNKLKKGTKFKAGLVYQQDYEVIPTKIWSQISSTFNNPQCFERNFVRHPSTLEPTVLFKSFSLSIEINGKIIKKETADDWRLIDIKKQICDLFTIDSETNFFHNQNKELIDEKLLVSEYIEHYSINQKLILCNQLTDKKAPTFKSSKKPEPIVETPIPTDLEKKMTMETTKTPRRQSETVFSIAQSMKLDSSTVKEPAAKLGRRQTNSFFPISQPNKIDIPEKTEHTVISPSRSYVQQQPTQRLRPPAIETDFRTDMISPFPRPVGLINLGNTCFFNAAVQCLVRIQPLTAFMLSPQFDAQLNPRNPKGSGGKIAHAYREFCMDLCNGGLNVRNPRALRSAIVAKFKQFANYGQHDSQELLGALLDGLHEDFNQSSAAKGRLPPSPTRNSDDSWTFHISKNASPILNMFHGELFSAIDCPLCGNSEKITDPFVFLSLSIPNKLVGSVKLSTCLKSFSSTDTLDSKNKWKCSKCKRMVQAHKRMGVQRCAPILLIHFKRFSGHNYYSTKIDTCVEYEDIIDTRDFAETGTGRYKLIAAVFHSGSLGGGHYTAAAYDLPSKSWYYFNDSIASPIDPANAHSSRAYVLFYQKL